MADLSVANSTYATGTPDTATALVNNVSPTDAAQYNGVASAVVGIEGILGNALTLKGDLTTLVERLAVQILSNGIINPIGSMQLYAGSSAPTGFLLCDGSAVNRVTYANLFSVISTTYGPGDSATTFNLPDMRGRVPVGAGTGIGGGTSGAAGTAPAGGSALTAIARGAWKGTENASNISHTHTLTDPGHTHGLMGGSSGGGANLVVGLAIDDDNGIGTFGIADGNVSNHVSNISISTDGASGTGLNIQPVLSVNYIIKT